VDVLDSLDSGLGPHQEHRDVVVLREVATAQKKRIKAYLEEKKSKSADKSSAENKKYQDELKSKIKLISMIGGNVYKKIVDKMKLK
jgi:hypothetical protein